MRVFVSYKETNVDPQEIEKRIWEIRAVLDYLGYSSFIFWYDAKNQAIGGEQVLQTMIDEIKKADLILSFINYPERSEWELLELGMAYAMNKKIVTFMNQEVESWYRLIDIIGEKVLFESFEDFRQKLFKYMWLYLPREEIDQIDQRLLEALHQRFERVQKIGKYKKLIGEELFQPQRWEQVVVSRVSLAQKYGLSEHFVKELWDLIHQEALNQEKISQIDRQPY